MVDQTILETKFFKTKTQKPHQLSHLLFLHTSPVIQINTPT